ncbi:MAG: hypothetical protein KJ904_09250 [Alphaproteobacteria bacterium]|nr:hypothetical protein [Alphaproteobacteria bacterium]MBU0795715.1 hypothetical protein [Alphaproteobacteria bacterium]MBU0887338.1 hypothetical protein [Alphaproteobacteria bacterium]MBU1811781.1 hypothetical protein [Alphaproteobacteria bacterium]
MGRVLVMVLGLAVLSACDSAREEMVSLLGGAPRDAEARMLDEVPVYCYHTLARAECYSQPLPPKEAGRLVSFFGPPPQALTSSGPTRP